MRTFNLFWDYSLHFSGCQRSKIWGEHPNLGANVPGTGEALVRLRTICPPVPGTLFSRKVTVTSRPLLGRTQI